MGFPVYDYRRDIRNVLVSPQIRARFMPLGSGESSSPHTHDLGYEIFLILQGTVEFNIDGEIETLGPGQMCYAAPGQMHSIRVVSDEDMIMYLSVTPHIQPTHTMWAADGQRLPHRFVPNSSYDVETDDAVSLGDVIERQIAATDRLAASARSAADRQREILSSLQQANVSGDDDGVREARSAMWDELIGVYRDSMALADAWNDLAPRAGAI